MQDHTQILPQPTLSTTGRVWERALAVEMGGVPVSLILCAACAVVFGFGLAFASSGRW